MQITIDIRISGCATRCWHCYVNGGPGPIMPLEEYRRCLDALIPIFDRLEKYSFKRIDLWLDYEPLLHPDICEILTITKENFGTHFDTFNFPTTGIPIATRSDWEEILDTLRMIGTNEIEFTLHGPEHIQNKATNHPRAFELHLLAVRRAQAHGFETALNLMVTKDMLQHFEETMEVVRRNGYERKRAAVPVYEPIPRLRRFEMHRPTLEDVEPFREYLANFCSGDRDAKYWEDVDRYAERNVLRDVLSHPENYPGFAFLESRTPYWIFATVVPGLSIYYGNAGLYHRKLGVLGVDSPESLVECIRKLKPNYQFGGFYDVGALPAPVDVARRFGDAKSGKLYHTVEDVFFRWLDLMDMAGQI